MDNSFLALAEKRYSCRAYTPEAVSDKDLGYILECARVAPSAVNRQPCRLMLVTDESGRDAVAESYDREWIRTAPMYIVVLGDPAEGWVRACDGHSHIDIDCAIVAEHICLAASDLGLGTCWVCNFDPVRLTGGLGVPDGLVPAVIIPLGHPAQGATERHKIRKSIEEIVIRH